MRGLLAALAAGLATVSLLSAGGNGAGASTGVPDPAAGASLPLSQSHRWIVDARGRVVILHGLNQVAKVAPYVPGGDGFGADDAAFLQRNGFTAMRIGVIWAGVEPRPGVIDPAYLRSVAATVHTLAEHGIVSLLDFHQDLFGRPFAGEGAPDWAVQTGGLPNPPLGFPGTYFGNPAEQHAWDAFWGNSPGPDGVGLQQHYANAWRHVAAYFRTAPSVLGYEVMNEPFPGTAYVPCFVPSVGCPAFDRTLTAFSARVTAAIRTADPYRTVWIEPNVLSGYSDASHLGHVADAHIGLSFHDYCPTTAIPVYRTNVPCPTFDAMSIAAQKRYSVANDVPWLLTEFGATNDLDVQRELVPLTAAERLGWLEWAYTGGDITSSGPDEQALVLDPHRPPTGANVDTAKLAALAAPYPQVVAGTPSAWTFGHGVLHFSWTTARVSGGRFGAGAETDVATPTIEYPHGYRVTVSGAHVVSAPGAAVLRLVANSGARTITLRVQPS